MMSGVEWTQEACLRLINELRQRPLLWDPKDPKYRLTTKKEQAWLEIADCVNADVEEVKRKMESLKGSFRRERWRKNSGLRKGIPYASRWFAYDALKFLEDREDNKFKNIQFVAVEPDEYVNDNNEEDDKLALNDTHTEQEIDHQHPRKKMKTADKKDSNENYRVSLSYDVLQEMVQNVHDSKRDECTTFADYIATKLRKFDDRLRMIAQHKITNALFELEMSLYPDNPSADTKFEVV